MREIHQLYQVKAESFWATMNCHASRAGFSVPNYQRTYDWGKEKIGRLLEDCANGMYQLVQPQRDDSFTFLGSLILVREQGESSFEGTSLSVVDGQQRLTTLLLTSCALIEVVNANLSSVDDLSRESQELILNEAEELMNALLTCIIGKLPHRSGDCDFPRMIRVDDGDKRGNEPTRYDYSSLIALFLQEFANFYKKRLRQVSFPTRGDKDGVYKRFKSNYEFIRNELLHIAGLSESMGYVDCQLVPANEFHRRGFRNLLPRLGRESSQRKRNRISDEISRTGSSNGLIRLILFGSYLCKCVVLTRVETSDDEDVAFDIFDALNTTGEPLTAIETFRPHVINAVRNRRERFKNSFFGKAFEDIESVFRKFEKPEERQSEARDIVVSFALYADGSKESRELRTQRSYLKSRFSKLRSKKQQERFVRGLADMTQFRAECWNLDGIRQASYLGNEVRLCLRFIRNMRTSIALPLIARYWVMRDESTEDKARFVASLKAITAFIAMRRAVTGGTAGIDSVFRGIMSGSGDNLCYGLQTKNPLLPAHKLKELLQAYLADSKIGVTDKQSWIERAKQTEIADKAKPLAKFLVLAASQYARLDASNPGLMTRADHRESVDEAHLSHANWISEHYKSIEHVAPVSNSSGGWDVEIYRTQQLRHTLGNVVLLPQRENSILGNSPWPKKKYFYLALSEKTRTKQEEYFEKARSEGFEFSRKTVEIIKNGPRLLLLDPIRKAVDWDAAFIQRRTVNLLDLAWGSIAPWLWGDD